MKYKHPLLFCAFSLCLGLQAALSSHLQGDFRVSIPPEPENVRRWDPRLFQALTFGHLPVAIDWLWIQILMDQDISHVSKGTHPKTYYDFDLIADLDPLSFEVYTVGANLLAVVRDDGEGARSILMKGNKFRKEKLSSYPERLRQKYWRSSWNIPLLLGYVNLFELNDLPQAAIFFREAAELPGAPKYLMQMNRRLSSPGGEYEVGLRLLNSMIDGARTQEEKRELLKKRQSLFIGQYLFDLNHSFREFLRGNRRFRSGELSAKWKSFLRENRMSLNDPWGGLLSVDADGRIRSTTPHERVFNLD